MADALGSKKVGRVQVSSFGWLDSDEKHREMMLELVRLFQDEGSVDELGIGGVRDAFANRFFPATSVLHTRARYLLFIPWLLEDVTRHGWPAEKVKREFRDQEVKLIRSLVKGGEKQGVIGRQAGKDLKTMPSSAYWAALRQMRICLWDTTIEGYLRQATSGIRGSASDRSTDDAADGHARNAGIHTSLPERPSDLLKDTTFDLTADEAAFLKDRLIVAHQKTVYSWLALKGTSADVLYIWEHPQLSDFPSEMQAEIKQARQFHFAFHGAAITYNLLLARLIDNEKLVDEYTDALDSWDADPGVIGALNSWHPGEFWQTARSLNPRIPPATEHFVNNWVELAKSNEHRGDNAARLLAERERRLKGNRSRLGNPDALQRWSGRAGMARLDYRWSVAASHLRDIYEAVEV